MLNNLLNLIFPEHCPVCSGKSDNRVTAPLCSGCWTTIRPYLGPVCGRCGRPLASVFATICGDCIRDEPAFTSAGSFGLYEGVLRKAVNLIKYHNVKRLSKPLSRFLPGIDIPVIDVVLPVPLHPRRLRQREFNQSALLARHTAGKLGADLLIDCLIKIRDTMPQVGLNSGERKKNIRDAFAVRNGAAIAGRNVLLIDDVITTGSTVRECARMLKQSGAKTVYVAALAHGVMD